MNKYLHLDNIDTRNTGPITYFKLFWLFMIGSIFGLFAEGFWTIGTHGRWETHVTFLFFPLCGLYGLGAAVYYSACIIFRKRPVWQRYVIFCTIGAGLELIIGIFMENTIGMYAWNYSRTFLHYKTFISLSMTLIWGALGILCDFLMPGIEFMFCKMNRYQIFVILCRILTVFILLDFVLTVLAIMRWSGRHYDRPALTVLGHFLDEKWPDTFMARRFVEWRFFH